MFNVLYLGRLDPSPMMVLDETRLPPHKYLNHTPYITIGHHYFIIYSEFWQVHLELILFLDGCEGVEEWGWGLDRHWRD